MGFASHKLTFSKKKPCKAKWFIVNTNIKLSPNLVQNKFLVVMSKMEHCRPVIVQTPVSLHIFRF